MNKINFSVLATAGFISLSAVTSYAQTTSIAVGEAKTKKPMIALSSPSTTSANITAQISQIQKTIENDLNFSDQFRTSAATEKNSADYSSTGTIKSENDHLTYEFHLTLVGSGKEILGKRYSSDLSDYKTLAHSIANDIVLAITGKKGIFLTKIAFSCDHTGKKEIYTMNFDGSEVRQITKNRSISMGASWSPDGTKLGYSLFNRHSDGTKNIDLFEYNFRSGGMRLLSNRKGINSGISYHPNGKDAAVTLSYAGNPDIYLLNVDSRTTTPLTKSVGFDVDPSFSPDGSRLAFVSSRAGKPMVYTLNLSNPSDVKRITFAGQYNATPNWSPDSKKIIFAGWIDSHFDIFTVTADGSKIERFTKNEGNNEDPSFSPDGSMVVFSSNRANHEKGIYIMNSDGTNVKRLTFGLGNCSGSKWSPYL